VHPAAQIGEAGGWAVELVPLPFFLTPGAGEGAFTPS